MREPASTDNNQAASPDSDASIAQSALESRWAKMNSSEVAAEVADCLFSAALLTRTLNRLLASGTVTRIDARAIFANNSAIVTRAVTKGLVETDLDEESIASIQSLLNAIEEGRARIERFRVTKGADDIADRATIAELATHWRRVCALGVFVQLGLKRAVSLNSRPHRFDRLIKLLADAGLGRATPCTAEH